MACAATRQHSDSDFDLGSDRHVSLAELCSYLKETGAPAPAAEDAPAEDADAPAAAAPAERDDLEAQWRAMFARLVDFRRERGHCRVPRIHAGGPGANLGAWVATQRSARAAGRMPAARVRALDAAGFVWDAARDVEDRWAAGLAALEAFVADKGHGIVPRAHVAPGGFALGSWAKNQRDLRARGSLSDDRVAALDAAKFPWDAHEAEWALNLGRLAAYKAARGTCDAPLNHESPDGAKLGKWVARQRESRRTGALSADRVARLEALGFVFEHKEAEWSLNLGRLAAYKAVHGTYDVPQKFSSPDGAKLGQWVMTQRASRRTGAISADRVARLDALEFVWNARPSRKRAREAGGPTAGDDREMAASEARRRSSRRSA